MRMAEKRPLPPLNDAMAKSPEGKCIDTEIMSKRFKQSDMWTRKKHKPEYMKWKEEHAHSANHVGRCQSMDAAGMKKIFCRFVRFHGLRYTFLIGDGGTKPFDGICKLDPYPGGLIT